MLLLSMWVALSLVRTSATQMIPALRLARGAALWEAIACAPARPLSTSTEASEQPSTSGRPGVLYPTHVPLHGAQKGAVAVFAALGALIRPARADLVAAVGETWGDAAMMRMRERMRADPEGSEVLRQRPRVTDASVGHCWSMPEGTFGAAYARFMGSRGFRADDRPPVRFVDDEELAYVLQRAREVHDFWHVLFGCHTNVFGELALKAVEFVQTGLPMTALAVGGAQFRLPQQDRQLLWSMYLPWAARAGMRSADLMCLYYERHLHEELDELRRRWRIVPAPELPRHLRPRVKQGSAPAGVVVQGVVSGAAVENGGGDREVAGASAEGWQGALHSAQ